MDGKDALFVTTLVILQVGTFLAYAGLGNIIVGHKITKSEDFLYPFSRDYRSNFGTRNRPYYFFFLYYIVFFLLLGLSASQIMTLRSTFRSWIDKLMGVEGSPVSSGASGISPAHSQTSVTSQEASGSKSGTGSDTSLSEKASKTKKRTQKPKKKKEKKLPNVMRSSVVSPENQVIPPLPRLSMREDTAEKLSRVLIKFDSMDLGIPDKTPPEKRKND